MFFIGFTGQLLTLVLTVCLPLIIFVVHPEKPENRINANSTLINKLIVNEHKISVNNQVAFKIDTAEVLINNIFVPASDFTTYNFPNFDSFLAKLIPSDYCNKAPPQLFWLTS